jgi:hypothetical protein
MWQGPFATFPVGAMVARIGVLLVGVGLVLGIGVVRRARAPWTLSALAAIALAWLAQRNMAIAAPVLVLATVLAVEGSARRVQLVRGALLLQGLAFFVWLVTFQVHWFRPLDQVTARRAAVEATARRVPAGAPVLADSLVGPALLADHGRPIALQAKWETRAARDRVVRFLDRLYSGSIEEFVAFQREEVGAEWLLFDGHTLWALGATRYAAGLPPGTSLPPPGSALSVLVGVEGDLEDHYEIVWRESEVVGRSGTGRTGLWLGRAR